MKQDWEVKKLSEVVEFQRGLTYSKNDEVEFSENIVLRSNNIDLATNSLDLTELKYINIKVVVPESKKVRKGTLMICTANGSKHHLGKVALIKEDLDYAFGGFMGLLTPHRALYPDYLYYLMISDSYKRFISELSDGANINNLKFSDLGEFEVPLPSLSEQKRIVAILDKAFAAIDMAIANTKKNLQNVRELFESYLEGVFEDEISERKAIHEISRVINGYAFSSKDFKSTNKVRSIKITNVGVSEFVEEDGNCLPESFRSTHSDVMVKKGNIVIALTRTIISDGLKVALVPQQYDGALVNQRVAALIVNEKLVNHLYLFNFLQTTEVEKYVLAHVNTLMQPNLSINDLKKLSVPCPSINRQNNIVGKLEIFKSEIKELENNYWKKLESLEEMRKSLLERAFSGKL